MNGTVTIEVVVDTGKENGWIDPIRLAKLNKLSTELEKYVEEHTHVGKVVSLATIIKETNRAQRGVLHYPKRCESSITRAIAI